MPAAFLLILQQTLLIGGAFLTSVVMAQRGIRPFASVLGRGIAHLSIYLPALALYLIVLPRIYGFSSLGDPLQLLAIGSYFFLRLASWRRRLAPGSCGRRHRRSSSSPLACRNFFSRALPGHGRRFRRRRRRRSYLPSRFCDQRHRPHQSTGCELCRGGTELARLWFLTIVYFALAGLSAYVVRRRGRAPA